ncbi:hypothetical protein FA13DRAFT_1729731 [Coprinellus micaceus]|uniref:Major facilitator superfamily MFS-1 n=1 Tax=Coprinellus micaceus TaxID=71717 RepID=A0A4Y7TJV5_COPMI|nr:hypothetical protein FA13DRAFT_1729731 [Coprinellus micaceus]
MTQTEPDATPLPKLSMIVLSIVCISQFWRFGELSDEAEVALWTGIIGKSFSYSWRYATVAEKHGRRAVLVVSLAGTALTLFDAICIRLLQGVFAGSVGVARGSVAFITDPSNEGRAYAILGFCWGFGGVAGAIVGGSSDGIQSNDLLTSGRMVFRDIAIFNTYPYLLPCAIAAAIMMSGSILACFLGYDAGPREGAIQLPPEKDNANPTIPEEESVDLDGFKQLHKKISRRFSNLFAKRVSDTHTSPFSPPSTSTAVPLNNPTGMERTRTFSRTSRANGSAYGYSGAYRSRLASSPTLGLRRGSLASTLRQRRGSNFEPARDSTDTSDLNFAQRLLMANENAVTNIADLWVASAMNVDNDEVFESDDDIEEGAQDIGPSSVSSRPGIRRPSNPSFRPPNQRRSSTPRRTSLRHPSISFSPSNLAQSPRRPSFVPSIFSHSGVRTPPALLEAQKLLSGEGDDGLATIEESRQASQSHPAPQSLTAQLPMLIIVQYGVMALHTTTHDQIFMSYLVSDYESGGLNLNAGHFAQLIALMCFVQIAYQFYPISVSMLPAPRALSYVNLIFIHRNMGPPRGRFSHLAMFRIGTILFIPVVPYGSPEDGGNVLLMCGAAIRYAGTVFGYTAISILLNYMSPPSAVGYANGIAQSIVSLARCVGPVIGGYLWSASVQDHPSGYYLGFVICAAVCALTVAQSFLIR